VIVKGDIIRILEENSPAESWPFTSLSGGEIDAANRHVEARRLEEEAVASIASTEPIDAAGAGAEDSVIIEPLGDAAAADVAAVPVGGDGEVVAALGGNIKGPYFY